MNFGFSQNLIYFLEFLFFNKRNDWIDHSIRYANNIVLAVRHCYEKHVSKVVVSELVFNLYNAITNRLDVWKLNYNISLYITIWDTIDDQLIDTNDFSLYYCHSFRSSTQICSHFSFIEIIIYFSIE